jgi:hypothetical protein
MKIVALVLVLFFAPVFAQEISKYQVKSYIDKMVLQEEVYITLFNTHDQKLEEFTYPFNGYLEGLSVSDLSGELEFSSILKGGKTYTTCTFKDPLLPGENRTIRYQYFINDRIDKKENTYILNTGYSILANVKNFELLLALPEGYGIVKEGASPLPDEKRSDGRRVFLTWKIEEPVLIPGEFKVIVLYERLIGPKAWWREALFIAFIGAIGLGIYLKIKKSKLRKIEILKEDEQAIMKLVIEKDGIDQREIQRRTGFSKAKVSKILSELEKRGAIRKEPIGRRNKIFLKKI